MHEQPNSHNNDFTVADVLGDSYPSAIELAERMTEPQLRDRIIELQHQGITVRAEIAQLESMKKRLQNEALLTQQALQIAGDRNLE